MSERHFVLSLLLNKMGKSIDELSQFEGRKYFQKIVYFAQMKHFGLDMGFGFSLHPHGPYSEELSECAKLILSQKLECEKFAETKNFNPNAAKGLEQLKKFASTKVSGLVELDFLESAATLHFLWASPFKHLASVERKEQAIASCHKLKPHFSIHTCQAVFDELERSKLIAA